MAEAPITRAEQIGATRIELGVEASKIADAGWTEAEKANVTAAKEAADKSNGRLSLETIATGFNHRTTWKETAEKQAQTGFNPAGDREARAGTTEAADLAEIRQKQELYNEFLEKGYENLSDVPAGAKADKQKALRDQVEEFIKLTPAVYEAIPKAPGSTLADTFELKKVIERTLTDPEFRSKLAERLNGVYDPKKLPVSTESSLIAAQTKSDSATAEVARLEGQLTKDKTERDSQDGRLKDFKEKADYDSDSLPSMYGVTKEDVFRALNIDPEIEAFRKAQAEMIRLQGNKSSTPAERATAKAVLAAARTDKVIEYEKLESERKDIDIRLNEAEKAIAGTDSSLLAKRGEMTSAKTELGSLLTQRKAIQIEFVDSVKNAVKDTAQEHIISRVKQRLQEYPQYKTELDDQLKKEADEKIKEEFEKRWLTQKQEGKIFKKWVHAYNKAKTEEDLGKLKDAVTADGNPDAFVKAFLTDANLSSEQITRLMQDKGFVDTQRSLILSKLLTAHVGAGGKIDEGIQSLLTVTSWGRKASMEWINSNPEAKKAVETATGKSLSEHSLQELGKKRGKQAIIAALLMALGVAMVGKDFLK